MNDIKTLIAFYYSLTQFTEHDKTIFKDPTYEYNEIKKYNSNKRRSKKNRIKFNR